MPTRSGWNTPIRMFGASAGLVSGPRMLKIVRTPSSRRTGATFFIAGWWLGANMKPMPVASIDAATSAGVRFSGSPSASSTSALPGLAADAAVAVLADAGAAGGGDEHAAGRDVEGVRAVAAGADDVDQVRPVLHLDLRRELAHHLGRGGDLADRLLLDAQADQHRGHHHRRHLAAHDAPHQRQHLVVEDLAVVDGSRQRVGVRDRHGGPPRSDQWTRYSRIAATARSTPSASTSRWVTKRRR